MESQYLTGTTPLSLIVPDNFPIFVSEESAEKSNQVFFFFFKDWLETKLLEFMCFLILWWRLHDMVENSRTTINWTPSEMF